MLYQKIMATNDKFRASFKNRIEKSKNKTELYVKKILVLIDNSLTEKSPVDTGRFKRNWIVGVGGINYATNDEKGAKPFEIAELKNSLEINSLKINGQVIYITNSLPYAHRLEYEAWSSQSTAMVGRTLAEINSMINSTAVSLRKV